MDFLKGKNCGLIFIREELKESWPCEPERSRGAGLAELMLVSLFHHFIVFDWFWLCSTWLLFK